LPWVFGLLTLVALVLVVLHFGTIEQFTRLALAAQPEWFILACVAQAATYVSASMVWRQVLRRAGYPRSLWTLIPLGIAKLFTDQVVPSGGVSGAILVAKGLTRRGVPTNPAMEVLLVGLVAYFGAYLASVLTSLAILWLHGRVNAALFVVVAVFVAIVISIPSGVLWMKRWANRLPTAWLRRLPGTALLLGAISRAPTDLLRDPVLLAETISLEIAVFVFDALTLWLVFRALGDTPAIWVAFVSFIMASVAATIGPIPLGLAHSRQLASACSACSAWQSRPLWQRRFCCVGSPSGYPWCQVSGLPNVRSRRGDWIRILVPHVASGALQDAV
jgi:glycosyltransferase 2 family protein